MDDYSTLNITDFSRTLHIALSEGLNYKLYGRSQLYR